MGGGGKVTVIPFVVNRLTLGQATRQHIQGRFFEQFPENAFGFHLGGLISHGIFKSYAVTFDFTRMRLLLTPA